MSDEPIPSTPSTTPSHLKSKEYVKFFNEHGLEVVDTEMAEEATQMAKDPYSLFTMWQFGGSKELLGKVTDAPGCMSALDFKARPDPEEESVDQTMDKKDFIKASTINKKPPKFTMAGYMLGLQQSRHYANYVKETTGLDPYVQSDFSKLKELIDSKTNETVNSLFNNSEGARGGLFVAPGMFRSLEGEGYYGRGGEYTGKWMDRNFYPKAMRKRWLKEGDFIAWRKSPARFLDPAVQYGKSIGAKLQNAHYLNILDAMFYDKGKVGAKVMAGGMLVWFLVVWYGKRYIVNYRDYMTQQLVFAQRLNSLDEYYPASEASIHKNLQLRGYMRNYYEDEEDED